MTINIGIRSSWYVSERGIFVGNVLFLILVVSTAWTKKVAQQNIKSKKENNLCLGCLYLFNNRLGIFWVLTFGKIKKTKFVFAICLVKVAKFHISITCFDTIGTVCTYLSDYHFFGATFLEHTVYKSTQ